MGILIFVVLGTFLSPSPSSATPVTGLHSCLNNEDCLGAHRLCHRNLTMRVGVCVCAQGFRPALQDAVKCLNVGDNECLTDLDCRAGLMCTSLVVRSSPALHSSSSSGDDRGGSPRAATNPISSFQFQHYPGSRPNDFLMAKSAGLVTKRCVFPLATSRFSSSAAAAAAAAAAAGGGDGGADHPVAGLRPGSDFIDHYYTFGRRNRLHAGFHPQYIKFVEDAMLVLFLLCVLVTLMVVHRASCYRQFRNSRRNGPLRHILPHRDDQPPPYSNCGGSAAEEEAAGVVDLTRAAAEEGDSSNAALAPSTSSSTATAASTVRLLRGGRGNKRRAETPPPTYDEALLISQASNTPVPLYIALPAEGEGAASSGTRDTPDVPPSIRWLTQAEADERGERMLQQQQQQQQQQQRRQQRRHRQEQRQRRQLREEDATMARMDALAAAGEEEMQQQAPSPPERRDEEVHSIPQPTSENPVSNVLTVALPPASPPPPNPPPPPPPPLPTTTRPDGASTPVPPPRQTVPEPARPSSDGVIVVP